MPTTDTALKMAIDNDRIKTISAMFTEKPGGFGVPITDIDTGGLEFDIEAETLDEDVRTKTKPTRIGITLKGAVSEATVTLKVEPADG